MKPAIVKFSGYAFGLESFFGINVDILMIETLITFFVIAIVARVIYRSVMLEQSKETRS